MKKIKLTRGKCTLVDDADFDWLNRWKWQANPNHRNRKHVWYAQRSDYSNGKKVCIQMHRQILGKAVAGILTDHIDGNGLNNQRRNIRPATREQNNQHARRRHDNSSGFRGVGRHHSKWRAMIKFRGQVKYIGRFKSRREAARAYDRVARICHGKFALVNFNASR